MANCMSSGTPLAPWTDKDFFPLPVNVSNTKPRSESYTVTTTGIGVDHPNATDHFDTLINDLNHRFRKTLIQWHNSTISDEWFHYLLKIHMGGDDKTDILNPRAPLPSPESMVQPVSDIYRMLFALFPGLNDFAFEDNDDKEVMTGVQPVTEMRIFVSQAAFIMSLAVLGSNIVMAILFYALGIKPFLPRMPTTIGSLLAYIAPSRAVREYASGDPQASRTFGFGRYVGDDGGGAHIGIGYSENVVPLKVSALKGGGHEAGVVKGWAFVATSEAKKTGGDMVVKLETRR